MIIGFCGASSSGKTTLLNTLQETAGYKEKLLPYKHINARSILDDMGHKSIDSMTADQLQLFQRKYLSLKIENEQDEDHFCSDRTFVDIASYWATRDAPEIAGTDEDSVTPLCRSLAQRYTLHVFLPHGLLPFKSDGYRSENMDLHLKTSEHMKYLLTTWGVRWIEINSAELSSRVKQVLDAL